MTQETLSWNDKAIVLVLMIVITLGFGGCTMQVGDHDTTNVGRGNQKSKQSYHDRLVSGKVSIQESLQRAHAK